MKFKDFLSEQQLNEMPIPSDWSKEKFKSNDFDNIIDYAMTKSKVVGSGSSRVAFEVEYKGRPTILKIAKNDKGVSQNKEEVKFLSKKESVVIPMIDYDTENSSPKWVHVEKAEPISDHDFEKECNVTLPSLMQYINFREFDSLDNYLTHNDIKVTNFVENLYKFVTSVDVERLDLYELDNWGLYKGKPVILDIGLTPEVYDLHYQDY